jgi:hypothetical protein
MGASDDDKLKISRISHLRPGISPGLPMKRKTGVALMCTEYEYCHKCCGRNLPIGVLPWRIKTFSVVDSAKFGGVNQALPSKTLCHPQAFHNVAIRDVRFAYTI